MQDTYFKCNENFTKHEYFDSMENLKYEILKGIYAKGYQNPSKIQSIIITF